MGILYYMYWFGLMRVLLIQFPNQIPCSKAKITVEPFSRSTAIAPVAIVTWIFAQCSGRNGETVHYFDIVKNTKKNVSIHMYISDQVSWNKYSE